MCKGMSRRIEYPQCFGGADLDHIARAQGVINVRYTPYRCGMGEYPRAGGCPELLIAANMILMFVGIEDLGDRPASSLSRS